MTELGRVQLRVQADINPTEDPDKVRAAVERIFGELPFRIIEEEDGGLLVGTAEGLKALLPFQELLRRQQIRNAARRVLFSGLQGSVVTFYLNKQVAYVGHISFSQSEGESPLGPIQVEIESNNPRELIEWLAPRTPKRQKGLRK